MGRGIKDKEEKDKTKAEKIQEKVGEVQAELLGRETAPNEVLTKYAIEAANIIMAQPEFHYTYSNHQLGGWQRTISIRPTQSN